MANDYGNGEVTFEILEHIGVIATFATGWRKEINFVSWNGAAGKYDIREWDPSHERMSRGMTFKENEMRILLDLMRRRRRPINQFEDIPKKVRVPDGFDAISVRDNVQTSLQEQASEPLQDQADDPVADEFSQLDDEVTCQDIKSADEQVAEVETMDEIIEVASQPDEADEDSPF